MVLHEQAIEVNTMLIFELLGQEQNKGVNMDLGPHLNSKTAIIEELVKCLEESKSRPTNSSTLAQTVSFWLSYPHSKKVRMLFGRFLLECLHDC
mmetsp:Transcript_6243/g.7318  ORF Transcript_6243/g.7318 Transcript_6243/m.7318 type:complete len:94 (+) Transcript_6243:3-284(+)